MSLSLKKFVGSKSGVMILSIILGLGLASIFKLSCDKRSCIVYEAPDFSSKKIMKYNDKCYEPKEKMEKCDPDKTTVNV
jgi:hypothetical protein